MIVALMNIKTKLENIFTVTTLMLLLAMVNFVKHTFQTYYKCSVSDFYIHVTHQYLVGSDYMKTSQVSPADPVIIVEHILLPCSLEWITYMVELVENFLLECRLGTRRHMSCQPVLIRNISKAIHLLLQLSKFLPTPQDHEHN